MSFFSRSTGRPDAAAALPYDPRSPEGLAARWVRWVASAGPISDPIDDDTGEYAARNQPDDVFFLAGSYGKTITRCCAVPAGRDLFLPVVNLWAWGEEPVEPMETATGSLVVDGVPLEPDVIVTPRPFTVAGARLNGVTHSKKPQPVTVWGLWKLIPALSPGAHELRVVGGDGYGFVVDVRYRLVVGATVPAYTVS